MSLLISSRRVSLPTAVVSCLTLLGIATVAQGAEPSFRQALIHQSDTGKCLTAKDSKKVYVRGCADKNMAKKSGGKAQRWTLTTKGHLKVTETGRCLEPKKGRVKKGTELVLKGCKNKSKRQKWRVKSGQIIHKQSGLCIEGRGKKLFEDNKVELFKCKRTDPTQIWKVYGKRIGMFAKVGQCEVPTQTRLNRAFFTRAHNAYERKHFPTFSHAIKKWDVVEIDLTPAKSGVWVSHAYNRNENNCGIAVNDKNAAKKGNRSFKSCLNDLMKWHNANPNHLPKLVVLNLKLSHVLLPKKFKDEHMAIFQNAIYKTIGKKNLYRPIDRRGQHPDLKKALKVSPWPKLDDLRGKFIFLVNAGPALGVPHANSTINRYIEKFEYNAAAFACPFLETKTTLWTTQDGNTSGTMPGTSPASPCNTMRRKV